jgi:hypothetical protein
VPKSVDSDMKTPPCTHPVMTAWTGMEATRRVGIATHIASPSVNATSLFMISSASVRSAMPGFITTYIGPRFIHQG